MNNLNEKLARTDESTEKMPSQQVKVAEQAGTTMNLLIGGKPVVTFGQIKDDLKKISESFETPKKQPDCKETCAEQEYRVRKAVADLICHKAECSGVASDVDALAHLVNAYTNLIERI
jgi:hypothetical protein